MPTLPPSVQRSPIRTVRWALLGAVLSAGVIVGCSGDSRSEKRLPDSTFTQVLTELQLAAVRQSQAASSSTDLRDSIFAHHNVAASDFEATLRFYSRHPKAFEARYQTVIDSLQALQYSRGSREIPQTTPDSLYQKRRGNAEQ